jgi:CBS domain-containing protein
MSAMDQCPRCGEKVDPNIMNFCPKCGASLQKMAQEEFTVSSDDLVAKVRQLLHEGNVRRIVVKDEKGKTLLEIPLTLGVVGFILAPWMAALGVVAAMVTKAKIVVERKEK